jgi:transposase-like protein/IS1 family transposase
LAAKGQVNCYCCNGESKKFGRFQNRNRIVQRYRCNRCGTTFSESQPLAGIRTDESEAEKVVNMLCEGIGIRAIGRLTGLDQKTVMRILESAGERCASLLDNQIRNVKVNTCQVDETFCFVGCKQRANVIEDVNRGDQYLFLAIDADTKLILSHTIGKRDSGNALVLMDDLKQRVAGSFQLTTDAFMPYKNVVRHTFGNTIDFAQLIKIYAATNLKGERRYSPPECISTRTIIRSGNPDRKKISTSYIERTNLTIRLFNRRFTRLTLGYSKKIENLRHSTALFIAHFNLCRVHGTHKQTPAMAAGLTDHVWSVAELLGFNSNSNAAENSPATK